MDTIDQEYRTKLRALFARGSYEITDILADWPAYVRQQDLPRFLSHYELFKKVVDLPGCVIDLGVYRGASFFTWAALIETFCSFDISRRIYGFDSFIGLQDFKEQDGSLMPACGKSVGAFRASEDEMKSLVALHNAEGRYPGVKRSQLIVGDVHDTIPQFIDQHPGLKISLIHFDLDLYSPTLAALEAFYPLVVNGGIVCFDEYGMVPWQGETAAVDEYFRRIGLTPKFQKHPFTQSPQAYWVKEDEKSGI